MWQFHSGQQARVSCNRLTSANQSSNSCSWSGKVSLVWGLGDFDIMRIPLEWWELEFRELDTPCIYIYIYMRDPLQAQVAWNDCFLCGYSTVIQAACTERNITRSNPFHVYSQKRTPCLRGWHGPRGQLRHFFFEKTQPCSVFHFPQ